MRSWSLADMPCQAGRIALVTGANTGLGFQTARMLALHGADDVLACRNSGKGEIAVERIRAERPTARVSLIELDLADLDSVAACARAFVNTYGRLDLPIFAIFLLGFGVTFRAALTHWNGPFPAYLRVELAGVAVFLCFPIFWFWYQLNQRRNTAYALANRRLLVAVGLQREKMRAVKLEALDRVRVLPSRRGGKVLRFTLKGQDSIAPVWTSLDGRADKWAPIRAELRARSPFSC